VRASRMSAASAAAFVAALLSLGGASLVSADQPQGNGNANANGNGNAYGHVDEGTQTPATAPAPAPADKGGGETTSAPPAKAHGDEGKSKSSHGKGGSHAAKPHTNQANPNPGTPRKGGRADRPAGKITICHATGSATNPFVEITISVNGLHGHGKHGDDIIPAPAGGCPTAATTAPAAEQPAVKPLVTPVTENTTLSAQTVLPAATPAPGEQAVLGVRQSGGSAPAAAPTEASGVLGASAEGGRAPASATAPASAAAAVTGNGNAGGSLPFTGTDAMLVLLLGCVTLLGGIALQRLSSRRT
jgi:hypothetical protein